MTRIIGKTALVGAKLVGVSSANTIRGNKTHNSEKPWEVHSVTNSPLSLRDSRMSWQRPSQRLPQRPQNLSEPLRPVAPVPVAPSSFSEYPACRLTVKITRFRGLCEPTKENMSAFFQSVLQGLPSRGCKFWGRKGSFGALRRGPPFHGSRSSREIKIQNASCQMGGREVTRW